MASALHGPTPSATYRDVEQADAVLVLGEDVHNVAPMLALALRQASLNAPARKAAAMHVHRWDDANFREVLQKDRGPLFIATPAATRLDELATDAARLAPEDIARFARTVAERLEKILSGGNTPGPAAGPNPSPLEGEGPLRGREGYRPAQPSAADSTGHFARHGPLTPPSPSRGEGAEGSPAPTELAPTIAAALLKADRPLVITGGSCGIEVIRAAANIAAALTRSGRIARLCFITPACNSLGVAMTDAAGGLESALRAVEGGARTVIVLEADLARTLPAKQAEKLLAVQHLIVLDHLLTPTGRRAELVFPAATFAESDGTQVNREGRAQRFFQVFPATAPVAESWRWLGEIAAAAGVGKAWHKLDDVLSAMAADWPALAGAARAAPGEDFRLVDQKLPRQPHRYSGRTAMSADKTVFEPPPPTDPDAPMNFSMEGYPNQPPPALLSNVWAPGWNSMQAITRFQQEVNGPLRGGENGVRLLELTAAPGTGHPAPGNTETAIGPDVRREQSAVGNAAAGPGNAQSSIANRQSSIVLVPAYHVFGSEELSIHTPGIAQRSPGPYLAINSRAAERLGLTAGGQATLATVEGGEVTLSVRIDKTLADDLAAVPVGIAAPVWLSLPTLATLRPANPSPLEGEGGRRPGEGP
jgi:NADH-quinone oxidoreductase subunit G